MSISKLQEIIIAQTETKKMVVNSIVIDNQIQLEAYVYKYEISNGIITNTDTCLKYQGDDVKEAIKVYNNL